MALTDTFVKSVKRTGAPAGDKHRFTNVGNLAGTGLGMAFVKRSVELHSGSITVSSVLGSGTVFVVSSPLVKELS